MRIHIEKRYHIKRRTVSLFPPSPPPPSTSELHAFHCLRALSFSFCCGRIRENPSTFPAPPRARSSRVLAPLPNPPQMRENTSCHSWRRLRNSCRRPSTPPPRLETFSRGVVVVVAAVVVFIFFSLSSVRQDKTPAACSSIYHSMHSETRSRAHLDTAAAATVNV